MLQAVCQLWPLKHANLVEVRKTVNRSAGENDNFFFRGGFFSESTGKEKLRPCRETGSVVIYSPRAARTSSKSRRW